MSNETIQQDKLTERETEVLQLIAQEFTAKQIASQLDISVKTVEAHRANVKRKLRVHSMVGLALWAVRLNLVQV